MMDTLTPEERSERMRRVRSRDTKPELRVRKMIWGLGHRYRKHRRDIPGNPDIAFVGLKRAIFVHGCFWHRHNCKSGKRTPRSRQDFWRKKFRENVKRDTIVQQALKQSGWKSLIVWECEVNDDAVVARRLRKFLNA